MSLTIGILSWGAHRTLINTLTSYREFGLDKLANQRMIFFQELRKRDEEIANKFGYEYIGDPNNIGIAAAYKRLVEHSTSDLFLFLENDWQLIEKPDEQIQEASNLITGIGAIDVVRFRHRKFPGGPLWTLQYKGSELEKPEFLLDSIHWTDPDKFLINEPWPEGALYQPIHKVGNFYITTAKFANWTNNPTMFRTAFLEDEILPRLGNRDIEIDLQPWWREQHDIYVAQGEGLFTHNRIG